MDSEEARLRPASRSDSTDYGALMDSESNGQRQRLAASLAAAAKTNPDAYAKVMESARALGVPVAAAEDMPEEVQQKVLMQHADALLRSSPALARQMSSPEFSKLAHDDMQSLSFTESVFNGFKRGVRSLFQYPGAINIRGAAADAGLFDDITAGRKIRPGLTGPDPLGMRFDTSPDLRERMKAERLASAGESAVNIADLERQKREIPADPIVQAALNPNNSPAEFMFYFRQAPLKIIATITAENAPTNAAGMVAAVPATMAGGPVGTAAAMGLNSLVTDYASSVLEALQDEGIDLTDKAAIEKAVRNPDLMQRVGTRAAAHALPVAAFDALSGGIAGRNLAPRALKGLPKHAVNLALQAPVQGALGAAGEAAGELASGQHLSFSQIAAEFLGEFGGAPVEVAAASSAHLRDWVSRARAAGIAQGENSLTQLDRAAGESKLRTRDPVAFQQFIDQAAAGSGLEEVYVDARTFMNVLHQAGIDPNSVADQVPSVAKQLPEALATQGDLQIPVSEFAARIAGSEASKALLPHLRTSPEGFSQSEAQQFFQDERNANALREDVNRFAGEVSRMDTELQQVEGVVRQHVMSQLQATGRFTDSVNEEYSRLVGTFYSAMSHRLNESAETLLARYPLHVVSDLNLSSEGILKQALPHPEVVARADELVSIAKAAGTTPEALAADWMANPPAGEVWQRFQPILADALHLAKNPDLLAAAKQRLHQTGQSNARGAYDPATATLALLAHADLSTFLHEAGHHFLEVLTDVAARENAPAQIKADVTATLAWFGVKDLATWRGMSLEEKRPYHEKFAQGFEAYLFEGEAPSLELDGMFQRFRQWLIHVYRTLAGLNVQLSPEVRAVFGRMLAADEQIAAAEAARSYRPVFESAEAAGMSADQWAEYQRLGAQATSEASATLERRGLRDMQWLSNAKSRKLRELQRAASEKRAAIRKEAETLVYSEPVYQAMRFITHGALEGAHYSNAERQILDLAGQTGSKLSLPVLKEQYGDGPAALWRYLPRGEHGMVAAADGMHPDTVAQLFGFSSGDELVRKLLAADKPKDAVEGVTDRLMLERYGDLTSREALERAAEAAIHNDARARFVATELNALGKATKPANLMLRAARAFAERAIAEKQVRTIRPALYAKAEARAGREAERALKAGRRQEAAAHKQAQLANHQLNRVAGDALEEVEQGVAYLRRFNAESSRQGLDVEYLDQIDQLLEQHDLRVSVTNRELRSRESIREWVEKQREQGFEPTVDEALLAEANRQHFREMTLEEFRGLVDAVKNIEHLGRLKKRLLTAKDGREFAAVVDEVGGSIKANANRTVKNSLEPERSALAEFFADHRKLSSIAREMDGGKDAGAVWERLIRPMNDAGNAEAVAREKATLALADLFAPILKSGKLDKSTWIPAINASLTRQGRIAIALNWGNAENRQRVMGGEGWNQHQVQAVLDTLTAEEWQFVQSVWDYLGSYWPHIREKERRVTGVTPHRVDALPVETKYGPLSGGYYPIKYDALRSSKAEADNAAEAVRQTMQGLYTRAQTRRGHTKARVDEVDRPVRKDLGVIFQHVDQVIHDLSWHEWLIDANRLLRAGGIDQAIREHYGPEILRTMRGGLRDIAVGEVAAQEAFERLIEHVRHGATVAGLGWNVTTAALQPLGLTQSAVRIGPQWVAKGLARWAGGLLTMDNTVEAIQQKSDFMRLRAKTMQREINEVQGQVTGKGAAQKLLEASYFIFIQKMQLVADVPTWLGQYEKSIAAGKDELTAVALADQAVLDAQGGGQVKDLAAVQRGAALKKLFTTFYSFFNTTWNLAAERTRATAFTSPVAVARLTVDYLLLFAIPASLSFLLKGLLKGDLSDDPDELAEKLARENLGYLLGSVVGLRELGAALQGYQYSGAAGARLFSEANKLTQQALQGEVDGGLLRALNQVGGIVLHYPAGQVERMVRGVYELGEGHTANPGVLLTGPARD